MTTVELITLVMTHTEEVGATDAENATLRARLLARAQEVVEKVWSFDPNWDFKFVRVDEGELNSGVADLPANFGDFGDNGAVYLRALKRKLTYLEPRELYARLELWPSTTTYPAYYTYSGVNLSDAGTYRPTITVYPTNAASVLLTLHYNMKAPALADNTTDPDGLQYLPSQFHSTVILKGVQWLCAIDRGDGRASEFDDWFEREMKRMKSHHVWGRSEGQALSQYGGISAHRSW